MLNLKFLIESPDLLAEISISQRMSSSEAKSLPRRSKTTHLHPSASKSQSADPISLSSKTPEKTPQLSHRSRNRGIVLSIGEVRKVAESLQGQNRQQRNHDRTVQNKSVRRKIAMSSSEVTPSKSKTVVDEPVKLPEKYEILGEFFNNLENSIRLLQLKGSTTTFTNVCPTIERFTDRRFTHGHLAQLKYILPEAVVIKKVLRFDERTSCMKPELHVTINPDAIESDAKLLSKGGGVPVRKLFWTRLKEYYKSHPKGDEIPEAILPEPFNHPTQDHLLETLRTPSSSCATMTSYDAFATHHPAAQPACLQDNAITDNLEPANGEENLSAHVNISIEAHHQQPAVATHVSQSFRRRFSQKFMRNEADDTHQKLPSDSSHSHAVAVSDSCLTKNSTSADTRSHSDMCPTVCASPARLHSSSSAAPLATPHKSTDYAEKEDDSLSNIADMSTPAKLASTPSRLMTVTPSLPSPKRCYMSPDDSSSSSPNKLVRRPSRLRSLKFDTPVKNQETNIEADDAGRLSIDDDIFDILPENLLQSIREKERMAMEERNPAISQAKRRQKMIASLPKLFNMIHLLIHSINRSVITKEELLSKIISSHCDIVDRREVEEQLDLLLELVPEWISEKLASSGDLLMCINKVVTPETVRAQLEEAK